jgi:hypothetical protein
MDARLWMRIDSVKWRATTGRHAHREGDRQDPTPIGRTAATTLPNANSRGAA